MMCRAAAPVGFVQALLALSGVHHRAIVGRRKRKTRTEERPLLAIGHSRGERPSENKQPIAEKDVTATRGPNPTKRQDNG